VSETDDADALGRLRARAAGEAATGSEGSPDEAPAPPVWGGRPAAPQRPTHRIGALPSMALLLASALICAAVLTAAAAKLSGRHGDTSGGSDALAAATSGVATVLSYNYAHLDADFARAESLLTPKFRKNYDNTTAKGVKPLAAQYKAVSTAAVTSAGLVQAGADKVVLLVFVDQTVTNSQVAAPRLDRSRIRVTMVKRGDRWLIDGLQPV
jgi:Mce-associated membrane protein